MTDLQVSPIAFGTWQFGGDWGAFDEREAIAAVRHARHLGVDLFDTAQAYGFGAAERLLGRALGDELKHHRDDVVIATKGGLRMTEGGMVRDSSGEWLRHGLEQSLRSLGVDHVDLYQVHWPDPKTPFAETAGALQQLVDEGKIRHVGVSNHSTSQMAAFALTRPVETLQSAYRLFRREIEAEIAPFVREHDIGLLVYGPLAHGLLSGTTDERTTFADDDRRRDIPPSPGETLRRNLEMVRELDRFARERGRTTGQLAIAWTLAHPTVDVTIVGARRASHIEAGVGAADFELSEEDLALIDRITAGAVPVAAPSPESV
ncbi:MAG: hypothetical protein QOJ07_304 [Thermoleophilaceae bacterium]|jgi:aryl-alcohol dehydrogenase-like predicted oxidoreductase|nr:hypothetical protein [Thermoleophilaceae bacterium]